MLNRLNVKTLFIAKNEDSVNKFKAVYPEEKVITFHKLNEIDKKSFEIPRKAINAVSIESLVNTSTLLIDMGVENILIEKPVDFSYKKIKKLKKLGELKNVGLYVAYNRRFYDSIIELKKLIYQRREEIIYCQIEVSEPIINWTGYMKELFDSSFEKAFIAQSTHVLDLAFHLIGTPRKMNFHRINSGEVTNLFGSGVTQKNIGFTYSGSWGAPGNWQIEITTKCRKYVLNPLEELSVCEYKKSESRFLPITQKMWSQDHDLYKPGLMREVETFCNGNYDDHCDLKTHLNNFKVYKKIVK